MCGFTGFVNIRTDLAESELAAVGRKMGEAIGFRGPDDTGIWTDAKVGIALSHRRLSILDLTPEGHQPMTSESGRYVIVYNGEIYNFNEIQHELGIAGRYRSDTRVMLAAFERWGTAEATKKFNGIFAFAVWDQHERQLSLTRDRLGIKPLYYGWTRGTDRQAFFFGSDPLSFRPHPGFAGVENPVAISALIRFGFIPAPLSIYSGIYKLVPGKILTLSEAAIRSVPITFDPLLPTSPTYFDLLKLPHDPISAASAVDSAEEVIRSAVGRQLVSDVPVGAFLSGGIDSSLVVAMMRKVTSQVNTFSIGFETDGYDESATAAEISKILGTKHTEFFLTEQEVLNQVPEVLSKLGEPFGDSSIIPTALVSKLARQHVTVALSGDGGDELFGGYNRYLFPAEVWRLRFIPKPLRRTIIAALKLLPNTFLGSLSGVSNVSSLSDRLDKVERMLSTSSIHGAYLSLLESGAAAELSYGTVPQTLFRALDSDLTEPEAIWMLFDQLFYLPDDNLCKVDRASMGHSLEVRVPLLDNEVLAFSHRVPLSMKLRGGRTKWLLRQLLRRYLPEEIINLPKKGFSPPVSHWLRGPLKSWGDDLLASADDLPDLAATTQRGIWARLQDGGKPEDAAVMWNILVYWDWRGRSFR
jgi:asparagine synthase (glutamine-hydrolysing)